MGAWEKHLRGKHLERKVQQDENIYRYVPEIFSAARPTEGKSVMEKVEERRLRIVAKACGKGRVSEVEAKVD